MASNCFYTEGTPSPQERRGLGRDADPGLILEYPGIDKATAPRDRPSIFEFLGDIDPGSDRHVAEHLYRHGLRDHLLQVRPFDSRQKFRLGHERAVKIDVDQAVIEQGVERLQVL